MTDLRDRYRRPGTANRTVALVVVVVLVVALLGFLGWAIVFNTSPKVTSGLDGFRFPGDGEHLALATITVKRASESTRATCSLEALATDHSVVGSLDVPVTSGPTTRTLLVRIRTARAATSVDLLGCTAPGQQRPR